MFSESKLAGPGYITLNVIRVLNIISLLLVAIGSWIMLVMTVKTSNVRSLPFYFSDLSANLSDSSTSLTESPISLRASSPYFSSFPSSTSSNHTSPATGLCSAQTMASSSLARPCLHLASISWEISTSLLPASRTWGCHCGEL